MGILSIDWQLVQQEGPKWIIKVKQAKVGLVEGGIVKQAIRKFDGDIGVTGWLIEEWNGIPEIMVQLAK